MIMSEPPATVSLLRHFHQRLVQLLRLGAAALGWLAGKPASGFATVQEWARRRPHAAVVLAAALGVAWQMNPVIFSHRSLVTPDNGPVILLYGSGSTLPSCSRPEPDDGRGSDLGAMMWAHVPYAAVEREAIFRDHEWPLWDRYNQCGIPLLGQGLSMFGDPFHWLTIAFDSASWAWDLEYVLARWLFACGLGLAALGLGAGLAGALCAAFSAAFIGFFAFRYNHPAGFGLCYSVWIMVAWSGIIRARGRRALAVWLAVLLAATCTTMTSGTVKEAYMLLGGLHLTGVLLLLLSAQPAGQCWRKLLAAGATGGVLLLVSAPLWLSFLVVLGHSHSIYDVPTAVQTPPWQMIGFFDDLFFRELRPLELHGLPSTNFFVLLGVGWGLVRFRVLPGRRAWGALALSACVPLSLAFGFVPRSVLVKLPFLANIHHVNNTFSCVLIVHAVLLAAFGWRQLLLDLGTADWASHWARYAAWVALLLWLYFGSSQDVVAKPFFTKYAASLVFAVLALPWLAHWAVLRSSPKAAAAALATCAALCLWRHGEYRPQTIDQYVVHPGQRVDLRGTSPALHFVKKHATEPARVLGLGLNLAPGYGAMFGAETIYGVDALRSRPYHELMVAFHLDRVWRWELSDEESAVPPLARARDMLGVRYYLASRHSALRPIAGLRQLSQFDLDVYERPDAWPRAYFTDAVLVSLNEADVARYVESGDGRPFATVRPVDLPKVDRVPLIEAATVPRVVNPAYGYQLSTNNTSFKVKTTGPGVIVLSETYYKNDFEALLDGRPVPYFRVNHAFKGVVVNTPGEHAVSFRYRPQYFTLALSLSAVGLVLLLAAALYLFRRRAGSSP